MKEIFTLRKILLQLVDTCIIILINAVLLCVFADYLGITATLSGMIPHIAMFTLTEYAIRIIFGVYRSSWRYALLGDYLGLIVADMFSGLFFLTVEANLFPGLLPVSYIMLMTTCTVIFTCLSRMVYQYVFYNRADIINGVKSKRERTPIAIIGAGNTAVSLARTLEYGKNSKYGVVCFIDDGAAKVGNRIIGKDVYPQDDKSLEQIARLGAKEIVIAEDNATSAETDRLFNFYIKTGCKVRIYDYPLEKPISNETKRKIRDIRIEDLLFRDTINFDDKSVYNYYTGKTILVTGGGGSIGSELCRQVAKLSPKLLIILDIYENTAYDIQQELHRIYGKALDVRIEIASVRDAQKMNEIFQKYHPEIVFHAAAHKHVPLMENCCDEAVKNNVFGTYNVANAAEAAGVKKFITISTDKAVNPTNIMGASKRLCELIIESKKDSCTDFMAVRFGNVLGSNGSVIPLFKRQIENGGPLTITDKRIIRYFMTIPEATQLVMQAGVHAARSDIYVLDMGKPISILTLAENMIRLSGLEPYEDIDIVEVGLRPGEKLYEELLIKSETLDKTDNNKIFVEHDTGVSREYIEEVIAKLRKTIDSGDRDEVRKTVMSIVPTYKDADEVNAEAVEQKKLEQIMKPAQAPQSSAIKNKPNTETA